MVSINKSYEMTKTEDCGPSPRLSLLLIDQTNIVESIRSANGRLADIAIRLYGGLEPTKGGVAQVSPVPDGALGALTQAQEAATDSLSTLHDLIATLEKL